jgi:hypothetical protein
MKPIEGLLAAIRAANDWLQSSGVPYAVIGGVAASLHGTPRVTKDVDLVALADEDTWPALLDSARLQNIEPRIKDALEFAKTTRVLLLVHRSTGIELDVRFGMLPFEYELVSRAETRQVKKVSFSLASPEDVMVMKALALRPRDIADIEGILHSVPDLDLARVRALVSELSQALEGIDHRSELEALLRRAGRG